jgi:hypothetical protein
VIIGWDVSTSVVGVTVLRDDGIFVCSDHIDLTKMEPNLLLKAEAVQEWAGSFLEKYVSEHGVNHFHIVEDKLGNFSAGGTMMQTLMKLAAFNTTVSYIVWKESERIAETKSGSVSILHLHPSTVKSIMRSHDGLIIPKGSDKKKLTLEFVIKNVPGFPVEKNKNDNYKPFCFDRADSYITARAGFIRFFLEQGKEDQPA